MKHSALLLCEWLADRARRARAAGAEGTPAPAPLDEVVARVAALRGEHAGRWSKEYEDGDAGAAELATDALRVLMGFGLAARVDGGFVARPAAARFSPKPISP